MTNFENYQLLTFRRPLDYEMTSIKFLTITCLSYSKTVVLFSYFTISRMLNFNKNGAQITLYL